MRELARVKAGELGSWKRLSTRAGMHQKKCKTEVQSLSAEKENAHIFVLSHIPESGHGAPIFCVVSEGSEKQGTGPSAPRPTAAENKTPFALMQRPLVTSLRRCEAFRCRLGAELRPAGLL